jgi:hypothetical protein
MFKRLISSLVLCVCLSVSLVVSAVSVRLNDRELVFDVPPMIEDGRTLVPLRAIFEGLGVTVDWDSSTRTVTATRDSRVVKVVINSRIALVDGKVVSLDVPAKIVDGRTLVPLRFVSESFGALVTWDGDTRTVFIHNPSKKSVEKVVEDIVEVEDTSHLPKQERVDIFFNKERESMLKNPDVVVYGEGLYVGKMLNGVPHGKGTYLSYDNMLYVGDFVLGKYEGLGSFLFSDGMYVMGDFSDDLPHGVCKLYRNDHTLMYFGNFTNGSIDGYGELYDADGETYLYKGFFKDNKMHGYGYLYSEGELLYFGDFVDNIQHGEGSEYLNGVVVRSGYYEYGKYIGTNPRKTTNTTNTTNTTLGERNALDTALSYLKYMSFSHSGLISQLEYEGYSYSEAKYAVDNCGADWYEQAGITAKSYLKYMSFSRSGLISQLEYEGFTRSQAEYGVSVVGY